MYRVFLLCILLTFASSASAEADIPYNIVSFHAEVRQDVPNDQIEVTLAVEHEDRHANVVSQRINEDMKWALQIARSETDVKTQTRQYRTHPRHSGKTIIGWRGAQELNLKSTDIEAATTLVTKLQQRLQVKNMRFAPSDETRQAIEEALTTAALMKFTEKAERIRQALNADGYDLVDVNVGGNFSLPRPVMLQERMMVGAAAVSAAVPDVATEAGTSTVTIVANGRIQLR